MLFKKICIILTTLSILLITGCHSYKSDLADANNLSKKGDYVAAQQLYQYVIQNCDDKKILKEAVSNLDDMFEECFKLAKKQFDSGLYDAAKKKYQYILNNGRDATLLAKVQEKLDSFDSDVAELVARKRITDYYYQKSLERGFNMPPFKDIDVVVGERLYSIAVRLNDQSKENIIHAAFCFKRQSSNQNLYIYFVKDDYYKIRYKDRLTSKVKAVYVLFNGRSTLYFTNPDGSEKESMTI